MIYNKKSIIAFIFLCFLTNCSNITKKEDYCFTEKTTVVKSNTSTKSKENKEPVTTENENLDNGNEEDSRNSGESDDYSELDQFIEPEIDYTKADPLEKINKLLYGLHRGIDLLFVRPIALTYSKVLPSPIKTGLANFVTNLTALLRMLCWLLQGNIEEAGKTAGKFVTNTILGIGGIINVSSRFGLMEKRTGFGEIFKKWGVAPGPYIIVPGIGPATMRTAFGLLFDSFIDPVFLLTLNKSLPYNENHRLTWYDTAAQITALLINRAEIDPIYEDIENNSVNRYSKLRNMVLQQSINK
ncbi:MAG: VacJ family lipoprotein [Holosporales bacterium]|nr:VacJ family lipoprotein [Holosporales bacterium]